MWIRPRTIRSCVGPVCATVFATCCTMAVGGQCELAKLLTPDPSESGNFARSVAIDGTYLLVGMPGADVGFENAGAAYLFELVDRDAQLDRSLFASDAAAGDDFGWSVSISGDTAVVGSEEAEHEGVPTGAAYVYERDHGERDPWGEAAKLVPDNGEPWGRFGTDVAISGDTIVVGARYTDPGGAAYIFYRDPEDRTVWTQVAKLVGDAGSELGYAVAIDGDTAVVGDWPDKVAYVYQRDSGGPDKWGEVSRLAPDDDDTDSYFGYSVGVSGDTAVVGAWGDGAFHIFERDFGGTDNWGKVQQFHEGYQLGLGIGIDGDTIIAGARLDDDGGSQAGAAYLYRRAASNPNLWYEVDKFIAADATWQDEFGRSAAVSGDTVLIGANMDDAPVEDSGSAYAFEVPPIGDVDGDCMVGPHDLVLMLGAWGDCPAPWDCTHCYDLDGDCTIGSGDLIILLGNWG